MKEKDIIYNCNGHVEYENIPEGVMFKGSVSLYTDTKKRRSWMSVSSGVVDLKTYEVYQVNYNNPDFYVTGFKLIEPESVQLKKDIAKLKKAIISALNISDLWCYFGDVKPEHVGEAKALLKMKNKFTEALGFKP